MTGTNRFTPLISLCFFVTALFGAAAEKQQRVILFCAASLTDVISECADSFSQQTRHALIKNFASSVTLARQIVSGAPADIYFSANRTWMDHVDSLGLIYANSKRIVASNRLVLITPQTSQPAPAPTLDTSLQLPSLLKGARLSLGDPQHVPAGRYAKEALIFLGWYSQLQGSLAPAKDVRSALMMVEMGETPFGIVYATDAQKSTKVAVAAIFPARSHSPVGYWGGLCSTSPAAAAFFAFVTAKSNRSIWEKHGFIIQ
jgi:molybdate transport system substrate-binding protein